MFNSIKVEKEKQREEKKLIFKIWFSIHAKEEVVL